MSLGCGGGSGDTPDIGKVSGTIKVDGQTKENLQVSFQPEEGRPSSGTTDSSGHYTLMYSADEDGAKVGKGVMRISSAESDGAGCCGDECDDGCGDGSADPIPPKYNSDAANNPEMNVEVKSGSNTFDFDVDTSGGGNPAPQCGDDCSGSGSSCCS
jgi:hypothetical protein